MRRISSEVNITSCCNINNEPLHYKSYFGCTQQLLFCEHNIRMLVNINSLSILKMTGQIKLNDAVTKFVDDQHHPLIGEITELRHLILSVHPELAENIKWNGPNYNIRGEDRITTRIQPPKQLQLIFHKGAKVQEQPGNRLLNDQSGLLVWKTNDRAVASFKNRQDIEAGRTELLKIVRAWLEATT